MQPLSAPRPLLYGTLELPGHDKEGPPDGLTLDQAIELLVHQNLDLRAKQLEIPQARADILTASLPPIQSSMPTVSSSPTALTRCGGRTDPHNMMLTYHIRSIMHTSVGIGWHTRRVRSR